MLRPLGTLAAAMLALQPATVAAQRLSAPARSALDEVFAVSVTGLAPGQRIALRAETPDSAGHLWGAEAEFVADARGQVQLNRDAPVSGSYTGADPMGLVTSMTDLADSTGAALFTPPGLGDTPLRLLLRVNGRPLDSATVMRSFIDAGVRSQSLRGPGHLVGTLFLPPEHGRLPGIVVLGGSEGGNSAADVAAQLAGHSFVTLSLAYFGADSLPAELQRIPLEYITQAVTLLRNRAEVDSTAIGLIGSSKGAEAALLVAERDARVRAVVAYAPSSVAWSCICSTPDRASWTWQGRDVPFVPPGADPAYQVANGQPRRPVVNFRYRLRDSAAVAAASIHVERIRGPVLLVAGESDELWPSADMARSLMARRLSRQSGDTLLIYLGAGHRIGKSYLPAGSTRVAGGRIETGGTPRANALAQGDSWLVVLRFLAAHLRQ